MAQSYSRNIIHAVFAAKGRSNLIPPALEEELWAYIVGIGRNKNIPVIAVGGMPNHLHVVFALLPTRQLSDAMNILKSNSSRWMGERVRSFGWQNGYGAFGVCTSQLETVIQYVRNQKEHHRRRTFEEEFMILLKKAGIEFDSATLFE